MNSTEVGVFEQSNDVGFCRLLQCAQSRSLDSARAVEIFQDFSDKSNERLLSNQQLRALLVASNFYQGHLAWPIPGKFCSSL